MQTIFKNNQVKVWKLVYNLQSLYISIRSIKN